MSGKLYIVATPIGNLEDLTFRAKRILETVDLIACEDTRHSGILLKHYEIKKPLLSFHSHSGLAKIEKIIQHLVQGDEVALISDAGTPGISDPAYSLVQAALENQIQVIPIPGASAVITALCASGLPTDKFVYLGFPPAKKGRQSWFLRLKDFNHTVVFYESPHRLIKTIHQLQEYLPENTKISIGKELTKIHETFFRGLLKDALVLLPDSKPKGEYVVMIFND